MNKLLLSFCLLIISVPILSAQTPLWQVSNINKLDQNQLTAIKHLPSKAKFFKLEDAEQLRSFMDKAQLNNGKEIISIPMPDGNNYRCRLQYSPILEKGLETAHPEIKTFYAKGIDNPAIEGRVGINSSGFFGLFNWNNDEIIVQQAIIGEPYYFIYRLADDVEAVTLLKSAICGSDIPNKFDEKPSLQIRSEEKRMRHFRVAISTTSGFSNDVGGTQQAVLNKIVEVLNGVNLRYNKDMGMQFDLISRDTILFNLDPATDYFRTITNGGSLLGQNQDYLRSKLNNQEYDFGQVWTTTCTDVGGVVSGAACEFDGKARGVSCGPNNVGYFLTTAKHEMGHQFSASHTFNRCGESSQFAPAGAYEPGSGSTIMAYPGACGSDNVQGFANDYFHCISILQMTNFITDEKPSCGTWGEEINHTPDPVLLLPNRNITIPANTPYELIGTASDQDGDPLVYNWEEFDRGNNEPLGTNEISGPLNRSYQPRAFDTLRLIPKYNNLINGTTDITDRIPTATRKMNWRFNVRDQNLQAGSTISTLYTFNVDGASGPFQFTFPASNTDTSFQVGQYIELTWDVANTDNPPVDAKFVDILISPSVLYNFKDTLVLHTPNDGREFVMLPYDDPRMRFKIKASDNIFLDVSKRVTPVSIPATPGYSFDVFPHNATICKDNSKSFKIKSINWGSYNTPIKLELVSGWPANTQLALDKTIINPGESTDLSINTDQVTESGKYKIIIRGVTTDFDTLYRYLDVDIYGSSLLTAGIATPLDGATNVEPSPTLIWNPIIGAKYYYIELSNDPLFSPESIILNYYGELTTAQPTELLKPGKIYYWRIRAQNECYQGPWSKIYTFQTQLFNCYTINGLGLPIGISSNPAAPPVTVDFDLSNQNGIVSDVNVTKINIAHGNLGNLQIFAQAPSGKQILIFGNSCTGYSNMRVTFDDQAFNNYTCSGINSNNTYKPANPLADFIGENVSGKWSVLIKTIAGGASGSVNSIDFELCATGSTAGINLLTNELLQVKTNNAQTIGRGKLAYNSPETTDDDQIIYVLLSNPAHGHLSRYGYNLSAGDTILQSWINDYQLSYIPDNDYKGPDEFYFMVKDRKFAYLTNQQFNIDVQDNYIVGNNKLTAANAFSVFPNPTNGLIRLEFNKILSNTKNIINIYNTTGKQIYSTEIPSESKYFDLQLSSIPTGAYYIQLANNNGVAIQKIIKL